MAEMKFFSANGVVLHYQHEGIPDGLPIVFINPLGCDLRVWDGVVIHLAHHFQVVRFDQRGHGLSDAPPASYSMSELAGDANALLKHLGINHAVVVGMSVGGMVALQMALDFQEMIEALVLCDTAARIGTADYWEERIGNLRQFGMPHLAESILSRWFLPSFIEENPATYRGFYNLLTRMPLEGYIGMCGALRDADLRDEAVNITVPALVLCGAEDKATTPEIVHGLADELPNARFKLIEGAAHTPAVEQPEALAAAIIEFMKEHDYAG